MATISERIQEALLLRGMKQVDLVNKTKIGKSSISTYISGEYEPKQKNIYKIAQALNVSEGWLMGFDVPMERAPEIPSTETEQLAELLKQLPDDLVRQVLDYTRWLISQHKS